MHTPSAKPGRTLGPGASLKSSHQTLIVILCMTTLASVKAHYCVGVGGGVKGAVLWRSS